MAMRIIRSFRQRHSVPATARLSDPVRDGARRRVVVCASGRRIPAGLRLHSRAVAPVIFRRRPAPSQLIVSTNTPRRVPSQLPAPRGPSLPMSEVAPRAGATPQADVVAATRDSGTVIAFLSCGGSRAHLTSRVYDVITSPEGCGLGRSSSLSAFADQFCDSAEGKRLLVQALAVHRPSADPTALLTRMAITAWVRTVGLAAKTRELSEAAATGLPDWHTPGDM